MKIKLLLTTILCFFALVNYGQAPLLRIDDLGQVSKIPFDDSVIDEEIKLSFIKNYIQQNGSNLKTTEDPCPTYIIPVVFHVYGTQSKPGTVIQNGSEVNLSVIQSALDLTNQDFYGLNSDFNSVHDSFKAKRGTLKIEFRLAQKDPNGNATNGIVFHPTEASYAPNLSNALIPAVAADAWDNFKYVNIYVQKDWEGLGKTNLSGVAWPPDLSMSTEKMARICFNGRYLGSNCALPPNGGQIDFAGVFTHEFGHFFGLYHPFDDNTCYDSKILDIDGVPDTPNSFLGEGCHSSSSAKTPNCPYAPPTGMPQGSSPTTSLCNAENYMNYNNCYKMFSVGQIGRIITGLNHDARKTLWQKSNLIATGVYCNPTTILEKPKSTHFVKTYPNPNEGNFIVNILNEKGHYQLNIKNLLGQSVFHRKIFINQNEYTESVNLNYLPKGIYILELSSTNYIETLKIEIQ
jgi:hypothetical protein